MGKYLSEIKFFSLILLVLLMFNSSCSRKKSPGPTESKEPIFKTFNEDGKKRVVFFHEKKLQFGPFPLGETSFFIVASKDGGAGEILKFSEDGELLERLEVPVAKILRAHYRDGIFVVISSDQFIVYDGQLRIKTQKKIFNVGLESSYLVIEGQAVALVLETKEKVILFDLNGNELGELSQTLSSDLRLEILRPSFALAKGSDALIGLYPMPFYGGSDFKLLGKKYVPFCQKEAKKKMFAWEGLNNVKISNNLEAESALYLNVEYKNKEKSFESSLFCPFSFVEIEFRKDYKKAELTKGNSIFEIDTKTSAFLKKYRESEILAIVDRASRREIERINLDVLTIKEAYETAEYLVLASRGQYQTVQKKSLELQKFQRRKADIFELPNGNYLRTNADGAVEGEIPAHLMIEILKLKEEVNFMIGADYLVVVDGEDLLIKR